MVRQKRVSFNSKTANNDESNSEKSSKRKICIHTGMQTGIFSLERIQEFFKEMKLYLAKLVVKQDYFELFDESSRDYQRFYNFVIHSKLCPVIAADHILNNSCHAMVVDKAIQHGSEWYFQCKNTYKANPQVFVGHASHHSIEFKPYDAIMIYFDRK